MSYQAKRHHPFAITLGLLVACGGTDTSGSSLNVSFKVFRDGANVECSAVSDITRTQVAVRSAGGIVSVPGFPMDVSCPDASFDLNLADGEYIVEVAAFDAKDAEIYKATRTVTLPASEALIFSLEPQKARLELSWGFETMDNLMPCSDEVESIDVTISASGTSGDSFNAQFACTGGPVWLDRYFNPRTYTLLVIATSSEGFTLFKTRETITLERGENQQTALLSPEGGQLSFDWQFKLPDESLVPSCSNSEVMLQQIQLSITTDLGDEPIMVNLVCDDDQPYVLKFKRFTQGTLLKLELIGDGAHRYRYYEQFLMPANDKEFGRLTLSPVGDATLLWTQTSTSGCSMASNFEYAVKISSESTGMKIFEESYGQSLSSAELSDLAYGRYLVEIAGKTAQETFCETSGTRVISKPGDNEWAGFEL